MFQTCVINLRILRFHKPHNGLHAPNHQLIVLSSKKTNLTPSPHLMLSSPISTTNTEKTPLPRQSATLLSTHNRLVADRDPPKLR